MTLPIYVLNGPTLNLLGTREPEIYGRLTLAQIKAKTTKHAKGLGLAIVFRQSNREGELVDWIQEARQKASGLILNAAAYSHTSIALLDAVRAFGKPAIEVHLSNLFARERYRRYSYISEAVNGVICGFKENSYLLAVEAIASLIESEGR